MDDVNEIVEWENLPLVALVGRPNTGKSTLFNRLLRKRKAIVDPTPGVTRDPIESVWHPDYSEKPVILVDTGGLKLERDTMDDLVAQKSREYISKADILLFVVDVMNITPEDEEFAQELRPYSDKTLLVVNKADGPERDAAAWNYASWGYKDMIFVSSEHGRNIGELSELLLQRLDWSDARPVEEDRISEIRIAIMGKPNTGKSTLLNKLTGQDKSIVSDMAGTTRDVVEGSFFKGEQKFIVLDTAGMRKKAKVRDNVEYYSVNRAVKTLNDADVVILIIDATEGLSEQDKKIVQLAVDKGRAVVFVLNKWDKMPRIQNTFEAARDRLRYFFGQMAWAPVIKLSALTGSGTDRLLDTCIRLYEQLNKKTETGKLNRAVNAWVDSYPPPVKIGARFKFRYAVQSSINPVEFIFFVTRPDAVPDTYVSYLKNRIREELGYSEVPVKLELRASRKRFEELERK